LSNIEKNTQMTIKITQGKSRPILDRIVQIVIVYMVFEIGLVGDNVFVTYLVTKVGEIVLIY